MKKVLWLVVACMLITVLASAEDEPMAPAFKNKEIRDCEYQTSGLLKRKDSLTGNYLGRGAHQGFLTEVNFLAFGPEIFGMSQVSPDLFTFFTQFTTTPYTCIYDLQDYLWDNVANKITHDPDNPDAFVQIQCWDPIQDPGGEFPFLDLTDCTASIKFTDPNNFDGKIKCDDGETKWILQLSGKQLGCYVVDGGAAAASSRLGGIEALRKRLHK